MARSGLERDVTVIGAEVIQPIDIQSRYSQTIQTHNAVSIPFSNNSSSGWVDTDGFTEIALTMMSSVSLANRFQFVWSHDGVNIHCYELPSTATGVGQYKTASVPTKSRYVKILLENQDTTTAQTMSTWAYLKA